MWVLQEIFTYIFIVLSGFSVLAFFCRVLSSIFKK